MDINQIKISKDSFFEGEVSAEHITVEGKVIGNLRATSSILIKGDGWVEGDIEAPSIYLGKGCYHKGDIYLDNLGRDSSPKISMNDLEFKSEQVDDEEKKEMNQEKNKELQTKRKASFGNP